MDETSIAERIAIELQARDDVASAVVEGTLVVVTTQGGKVYDIPVRARG